MKKRFIIQLEEKTLNELKKISEKKDIPISALIRNATKRYIKFINENEKLPTLDKKLVEIARTKWN